MLKSSFLPSFAARCWLCSFNSHIPGAYFLVADMMSSCVRPMTWKSFLRSDVVDWNVAIQSCRSRRAWNFGLILLEILGPKLGFTARFGPNENFIQKNLSSKFYFKGFIYVCLNWYVLQFHTFILFLFHHFLALWRHLSIFFPQGRWSSNSWSLTSLVIAPVLHNFLGLVPYLWCCEWHNTPFCRMWWPMVPWELLVSKNWQESGIGHATMPEGCFRMFVWAKNLQFLRGFQVKGLGLVYYQVIRWIC